MKSELESELELKSELELESELESESKSESVESLEIKQINFGHFFDINNINKIIVFYILSSAPEPLYRHLKCIDVLYFF